MSPGSRRALFFVAGIGTLLPVSTSAAAIPHSYTVVIDKMKFGPMPTQLRKGDAIIWINRDFLRHSATAADHRFDVDLKPGASAKTILTKSGAIGFVCRYHPGMRGTLVIK